MEALKNKKNTTPKEVHRPEMAPIGFISFASKGNLSTS